MRKPRIHYPGATYHAMARGVEGRPIFLDDKDRHIFIAKFRSVERQSSARILAYCLMDNHFHIAIKVGATSLSTIMHRILTGYASAFNHHRRRTGHLFQSRYKASLCLNDSYLIALIRYIHRNPVRAGLVEHPAQWRWSSYSLYARDGRNGELEHESDLPELEGFDPWQEALERPRHGILRTTPARDLDEISRVVSAETSISPELLRSSSSLHRAVAAKRIFVRLAIEGGWNARDIAGWLRCSRSSVSRYASEKDAKSGMPDPEQLELLGGAA